MASYVYLTCFYEEDGPECLRATLNRACVGSMLPDHPFASEPTRAEAQAELTRLLEKPDAELAADDGRWSLNQRWGGYLLHVIRLED